MSIPTAAPQAATREPLRPPGHAFRLPARTDARLTAATGGVVNRRRSWGDGRVPEPDGPRHACTACGAHVRPQQSCGVCGLLCLPFSGRAGERVPR